MRKIFLFMMVTLDGYMEGPGHDLSWHNVDEEFSIFASEQMGEMDTILFGRKTYELMESFWPSKEGLEEDPVTARLMNSTPKIVFSKTLESVKETDEWKNVTLLHEVNPEEIKKLKEKEGKSLAVLGSNNLCVSLLEMNLLDELRIMVNPVVIGEGTPLFQGLKNKVEFQLSKTRTFKNGNVLLYYSV